MPTANDYGLSPSLPQIRDRCHAENRIRYLQTADLAELAALTGDLMVELLRRGIQVAGPLGLVVGRIESRTEGWR